MTWVGAGIITAGVLMTTKAQQMEQAARKV